jgi:succinate dehydrogenase flavin-adding protein (antitoxin of CptAB toxin-antitoxin module)
MPKFEQQPNKEEKNINPVENPKEAYEKTEEDEATLKAKLGTAKSAAEIIEIDRKLQAIEDAKSGMISTAQEKEQIKEQEKIQTEKDKQEYDKILSKIKERGKEEFSENEIRRRSELINKLDEKITSWEVFQLQNLMYRAGDMGEEEKKKVWEKIEQTKKGDKEKSAESPTEEDRSRFIAMDKIDEIEKRIEKEKKIDKATLEDLSSQWAIYQRKRIPDKYIEIYKDLFKSKIIAKFYNIGEGPYKEYKTFGDLEWASHLAAYSFVSEAKITDELEEKGFKLPMASLEEKSEFSRLMNKSDQEIMNYITSMAKELSEEVKVTKKRDFILLTQLKVDTIARTKDFKDKSRINNAISEIDRILTVLEKM